MFMIMTCEKQLYVFRWLEERWDEGVTEPAGKYTFSFAGENESHELCICLCLRESYQQLMGLSLLMIGCRT
jgi:hypothetical protein